LALLEQGTVDGGLRHLREAVRLRPDWAAALGDLARVLATCPDARFRNGPEAVGLAERACELSGGQEARLLSVLDMAYAEAGRFGDAIKTAEKVREVALGRGEAELAEAADARLAAYRQGRVAR
jgi:cytochrome c-type biogenesis protein CcmH/NrfG